MTAVPAPLIEFFQQEAAEYLERLDQLLSAAEQGPPDAAGFVTQARALRGSAMMTRLDGLTDLAATVERIANGLRNGELRWDQRLRFSVRGALAELRALVALAPHWSDAEQRRSRTQSVALAAVAAGYVATTSLPSMSPASAIVPISRLLIEDGASPLVYRNPQPAITIAQRFRGDVAAAADGVAREVGLLVNTIPGGTQLAVGDGVRRALLGLADVADSYGATSISGLATRMARASLENAGARTAIAQFARLLMDRELTDHELAARVKSETAGWNVAHGTPAQGVVNASTTAVAPTPPISIASSVAPAVASTAAAAATPAMAPAAAPAVTPVMTPAIAPAVTPAMTPAVAPAVTPVTTVPVHTLLYTGAAALREARAACDKLNALLHREDASPNEVRALAAELSDLIDLASRH